MAAASSNSNSSRTPRPPRERLSLTWSQSLEEAPVGRASIGGALLQQEHPSQEPSQTQTEVLTQNPDLTQLGDEEDESLSPLPPYSPNACKTLPWGRFMPCSTHGGKGIDLLPRSPPADDANKNNASLLLERTNNGVSYLGLDHLLPSDVFNLHQIGRNHKCDVRALPPPPSTDPRETALQEWAYGMISNRHCKIYCMLDDDTSTTTRTLQVFCEDSSGNGTLINQTTLLRRGEKRLLHTGDQICLVNPQTLRKKIRSNGVLQQVLQQYSFVFVNVVQQQGFPSLHATVTAGQRGPMAPPASKRKAAVNVRAIKHASMNHHHSTANTNNNNSKPRLWQPAAAASLSQATSSSSTTSRRRISPRRQPVRRIEEEYDIRDLLGSGTVGQVRRAIHRQSGQAYAVKIISLGRQHHHGRLEATSTATFEAEAAMLRDLSHPYVVRLVDVFCSTTAVYLVMELLHGGDLFDRIVQKGRYTEVDSRRVMRRLLSAVYYLHDERNIVHRDLKPENILCVSHDNDVDVKLTDFGLAKAVNGDDGLKTFCGTPQYFAPEVLRRRNTVAGRGRYGKSADMWSLGVILYVLLSGTPPFDANLEDEAQITFPDEHFAGVSDAAKDLVQRLLVTEPERRLAVRDACKHDWIMTEDGDTHVHPLDDPKLLVTQKRLFSSVATTDDAAAAPPKMDINKDSDGKREGVKDGSAAENDKVAPSETDIVPVKASPKPPADDDKPVARPPLSPVSLNNKVRKGPAEEFKGPPPLNEALLEDADDPIVEEPLEEETNGDVEDETSPEENDPPVEELDPNAVTPGASNKTYGRQVCTTKQETSCETFKGNELSEDEIRSDFSERTESISTFSGDDEDSNDNVNSVDQSVIEDKKASPKPRSLVATVRASVDADEKDRNGPFTGSRTKRRRITDAVEETLEPNKKTAKNAPPTAKSFLSANRKASSKSTTKAEPTTKAGRSADGKQKKHTGGKQTTLSSWFKKTA